MKLGILNDFSGLYKHYINACEDLKIDYEVIDFISNDWIENTQKANVDGFLVRPSVKNEVWKRMFDEKLYFLNKVMNKPIYPSYDEIFIYENKKNMAYWLQINKIPHPKTWVFYSKSEAIEFVMNYNDYPLLFKTSIGSAALGVKFIDSSKSALHLINKIFTKFKFYNAGYTKWMKSKYHLSYPLMDDKQYNFIIFQEKIDVKVEWRMIKIGQSFFGHQKLSDGKFHSGSDLVGWVEPPKELLEMTKKICKTGNFSSMNVDIFEDMKGNYYVNELQSLFGSYNPSQMYINNIPGRFVYNDNRWLFEEGLFNGNGSANLRVEDFINKLTDIKMNSY